MARRAPLCEVGDAFGVDITPNGCYFGDYRSPRTLASTLYYTCCTHLCKYSICVENIPTLEASLFTYFAENEFT